jgi:dTDP-4-dehydrorhamnose reductase
MERHYMLKTKILVLGAGGMLGSSIFRFLSSDESRCHVRGTIRSPDRLRFFPTVYHSQLITDVDVLRTSDLERVLHKFQPSVVINCVGLIKQIEASHDPIMALSINSMLPHRLEQLCRSQGSRLIHISTDCVFSGKKGGYCEGDFADADDLYGRSKYLGEISYGNVVTLRTSIIGHELSTSNSLIDWFLAQSDTIFGYKNAIFSGLPAVEIARVIRDHVIPRSQLRGLYHLSAHPISKFELLSLVSGIYRKDINIVSESSVAIDRSLDSTRFQSDAGYKIQSWTDLIEDMHREYLTIRDSRS